MITHKKIEIWVVLGRLVYFKTINIDASHLQSSIYFLKIDTQIKWFIKKVNYYTILKDFIAIDYWLDEKKIEPQKLQKAQKAQKAQNKFYSTAL